MKPLFFLYVWLNLTRIAGLRKENLVKHIRKRTIQTGRLFFSSSLSSKYQEQNNWVCHKSVVSWKNKKNQKSTVFLNLFQHLPSGGKQMWFFDNFCKKAPPFLQCGFNPLSFSYLLQWAKTTLEENAKIVKEPQMLQGSCNLLIYNKIQNWSSYQNRALSHRRFWNKFRKTFWFGVLDFRYYRVVTHSNKFRFRLVLFSFFFVMKILA